MENFVRLFNLLIFYEQVVFKMYPGLQSFCRDAVETQKNEKQGEPR